MNPHAVKQADDQFYKMHPELVDPVTLQRRPLSMNPKDAKLRTVFTALNNIGITPAAPDDVWVPGSEMTIPTK